jgi:hypothetical protein
MADEVVDLARQRTSPKPSGLNEQELGVSSSLPVGSWTDWLGINTTGKTELEARSNAIVSIDQLIEMRRRDGQIRALVRLITLPILKAAETSEWIEPQTDEEGERVEENPAAGATEQEGGEGVEQEKTPEGGKTPVEEEGAEAVEAQPLPAVETEVEPVSPEVEFANQMFSLPPSSGGMSVTRQKFMRQALLALVEGFSCFEEVRTVPDDGPLKGKITLKKLAHRDSKTIRFLVDDKGGFNGVRQVTQAKGQSIDVRIPRDKVWYYAANEEENPFYGVSWFESAYSHYDMKRKLYYISHIAAQFAAVPGRVGTVPQASQPKDVQAFRQGIEKFAFNTAMVVKENYKVDKFDGNSNFDFLKLIDHQNQMIAKSVLAKFMEDVDRQVLIENANNDASEDFFVMGLEALMSEIAESLTHYLMPKFIDWNFNSGVYPQFKFGQLSDSTRDVVKEMLNTVATAQATKWTPEFIRELEKTMSERLDFEIDYDEIEAREDAEQQKMEEQQRQEQEQIQSFLQNRGGGPRPPGGGGGPPFGGGPPGEQGAPEAAIAAASSGLGITAHDVAVELARLSDESKD